MCIRVKDLKIYNKIKEEIDIKNYNKCYLHESKIHTFVSD